MSDFQRQLERGRLYAGLPLYQRRLASAQAGIDAMRSIAPNAYISLSFGKQSLVLAHMLQRFAPQTPAYFLASSETWLMHDYADVIDAYLQRFPLPLTIVQTNNAGLDISAAVQDLQARQPAIKWRFKLPGQPTWTWKQSRDYGDDDLQQMVQRADFDGWYWGLAKEESRARSITLSKRWEGQPHPTIFRYTDGKYRCCPLMHWQSEDLAAYIAQHDLPMLDAYRRHGLEARTTARVTRKAYEHGFMAMSRHYNMATLNALAARFPELRAGA
jgi:3'-phosphoadenosine 5'-phosphosulfate sulfotransferase (PAPS reductase)/FAD synthetase